MDAEIVVLPVIRVERAPPQRLDVARHDLTNVTVFPLILTLSAPALRRRVRRSLLDEAG